MCRVVRNVVIGIEVVWVGSSVGEVGRLGWDYIIVIFLCFVEGFVFYL